MVASDNKCCSFINLPRRLKKHNANVKSEEKLIEILNKKKDISELILVDFDFDRMNIKYFDLEKARSLIYRIDKKINQLADWFSVAEGVRSKKAMLTFRKHTILLSNIVK